MSEEILINPLKGTYQINGHSIGELTPNVEYVVVQAQAFKDIQAEVELLKADRAELIEALKYVIDHSMPNTYNNKKAIKVLKKSKERLGE